MGTILYRDANTKIDTAIGHVDSDGVIYNHPYDEYGCAIGHIGSDGVIYSDPRSEIDCAIGHIGADGVIYSEPHSEIDCAIGHVSGGYVYGKPWSEIDCAVGQYEGSDRDAAAIAFLLLRSSLGMKDFAQPSRTGSGSGHKSMNFLVGVIGVALILWSIVTHPGPTAMILGSAAVFTVLMLGILKLFKGGK